ncbi:glycoside hydrolase family 32 protein [Calocera cornea HHB12733]|uniref:Glycoside hydrolase family 32 protein n=1 Tax=Calocera cornea HHB12733 TaxID=1353952 RepID=A0A165ELF6_9BASI|nr:glycoside hydrolase family 32 protein [Calocera cornea HHB12733]
MAFSRTQPIANLHGPSSLTDTHQEHPFADDTHTHHASQESVQRATPHSQADYLRWRPTYHVLPPYGWANDPCGPGYDPSTGLYHLAFQWNPKSAEWEDISWGHCVSRDLVHWVLGKEERWEEMRTVLSPTESYDREGIYTGCFVPEGPEGEEGVLSVVYTSVSHSPVRYTLPYFRGSESLSIATSSDAGRTWQRLPINPILPGAPSHLSVRAWRDPQVSTWPLLSRVLGRPEGTKYAIISGSVEDQGPNVFLYEIAQGGLTRWSFLALLVHLSPGLAKPTAWTGDLGKNWEVCNFLPHLVSLNAPDRAYMTMSTEGASRWGMQPGDVPNQGEAGRRPRWNLWMAGKMGKNGEGTPKVEHEFGGVLDHGCFYAANGFWDPVKERTISWGWILEDDLPPALRDAQAWAGVISVPRELFVLRVPHVAGTLSTPLDSIGCFDVTVEEGGLYTVETLGIRPLKEQELLRKGAREIKPAEVRLGKGNEVMHLGNPGKCWEFEGVVDVPEGTRKVGMYLRHSKDMQQCTELSFSPSAESITVSHTMAPSSLVRTMPTDAGPHTLLRYANGAREKLRIRVFCDNSVLEVFANDRFAMSCRMYPAEGADELSLFIDGEEGQGIMWDDVTVWAGLSVSGA